MEDNILKTFHHIVNFVEDLSQSFGTKQHSLVLYNRLISKTKITHNEAISRHIKSFSDFVVKNNKAILEKNYKLLVDPVIFYSSKVNIKMDEIFKHADDDTSGVIWKHLLVISSYLNPESQAASVLKKTLEEKSNETEFLSTIVDKIEKSVDPNVTDPMSAIMNIMSSGVFTDLVNTMNTGMKNGSLNMNKLFGTVQTMMSSMSGEEGVPDLSALSNITNNLKFTEEKE